MRAAGAGFAANASRIAGITQRNESLVHRSRLSTAGLRSAWPSASRWSAWSLFASVIAALATTMPSLAASLLIAASALANGAIGSHGGSIEHAAASRGLASATATMHSNRCTIHHNALAVESVSSRCARCARFGASEMLESIRQRLRRTKWEAIDRAWTEQWRAIRARCDAVDEAGIRRGSRQVARRGSRRPRSSCDRDALDGWLRDAAPPGVPFEAVVLTGQRAARTIRRRRRAPPQPPPARQAADDPSRDAERGGRRARAVQRRRRGLLRREHGGRRRGRRSTARTARASRSPTRRPSVPVVLKEVATAAGLGHDRQERAVLLAPLRLQLQADAVVLLDAPVVALRADADDRRVEAPRLRDVQPVRRGVPGRRVRRLRDHEGTVVRSRDRRRLLRAAPRPHVPRVHHALPGVERRAEAAPQRRRAAAHVLGQRGAAVARRGSVRGSAVVLVWVLQRFYYGAELPGRERAAKKDVASVFTSALSVTTSDRTRDGWRLSAKKRSSLRRVEVLDLLVELFELVVGALAQVR